MFFVARKIFSLRRESFTLKREGFTPRSNRLPLRDKRSAPRGEGVSLRSGTFPLERLSMSLKREPLLPRRNSFVVKVWIRKWARQKVFQLRLRILSMFPPYQRGSGVSPARCGVSGVAVAGLPMASASAANAKRTHRCCLVALYRVFLEHFGLPIFLDKCDAVAVKAT